MISKKISELKKKLKDLKYEHIIHTKTLKEKEVRNNNEIVNFIQKHMDKEIFKKVFIYDIYRDPQRTVQDYYGQRNALLNIYDIHKTLKETFSLIEECKHEKTYNKELEQSIISYNSWIEHLEYVENIQKFNEKPRVLTLINMRIEEKKKTCGSGDYLIWLISGTRALEWSRSVI